MKNKLTICCGTNCYLAARNRMDKLEQLLEEEFGDKIEIVPSGCLGQCSKVNHINNPPYAKFNGEVIENATNENLIKEIKKRIT